jgi:solute carrier family 10 (sodium/bile acid cotransporter), member 7
MSSTMKKYWFLLGLLVLIPSGLLTGDLASSELIEASLGRINSSYLTATVLFLMAYTLDSRQFLQSLRTPGPVIFAGLLNLGLIPLLALALAPWQSTPDFRVGLMIAASVPCTLAAASVWTRKAEGNDAVSLLVTLVTNTLCVVITPFWLKLSTSQTVTLDLTSMTLRLMIVVLIPTLLGQSIRLFPRLSDFATRRKIPIGVLAQGLILLLVFSAAVKAGAQLGTSSQAVDGWGLILVGLCCIGLHLTAAGIAWIGGGWLGFELSARKAIVFAGSQKTLPIGVLLATDAAMFGNAGVPFAIFPMLMYHASQLLIDTSFAQRLAELKEEPVAAVQVPAD